MDLGTAGLKQQPFPTHGRAKSITLFASQQQALQVLQETHASASGLCLFQGPALSGKSTVIREFVDSLPGEMAVAVVDADRLNTTGLLEEVLRQFGYVLEHGSVSELLAMLRVFSMQQAVSQQPPLLIVENTHALHPGALNALSELARLKVRRAFALKMILVSDRSLAPIIETRPMESIRKRMTDNFHLRPMTRVEGIQYLQQKLRIAGSNAPETIFPKPICAELWQAAGGWPGILDRVALLTLSRIETLPATADLIENPILPEGTWNSAVVAEDQLQIERPRKPPLLCVTLDGQIQQELIMEEPRVLVGRSEHNDISLLSKFVSRHHALFVRSGEATFLMDLNSTNGLFVNSQRVTSHFLVHDDIVSIGNHRIKFIDRNATEREQIDDERLADTTIMKTLQDMRLLMARQEVERELGRSENLPTAGS
jgi:type II secretory pathway predicted ATPase ExeA